jgi:hypothetical protein
MGAGGERSGLWLLSERRAIWTPAVWSATVGRSRLLAARLRTARPATALAPIALGRVALRPAIRKLAWVVHARLVRARLLSPVRPGGRCALRAARGRALHPRAGWRHALPAWSVAIGATVARPRPRGRLPGETRPADETGISGRDGTAAHAVVTWSPGKPRTPIPRAIVTRQAGLASWIGAPADPGVGISPAFIIWPVFGV